MCGPRLDPDSKKHPTIKINTFNTVRRIITLTEYLRLLKKGIITVLLTF